MAQTKGKAKTPRGEERIQQLMEQFPEVPRTLVIKEDALREGIRPSAASRLIGKWALPDAPWYFEYNKMAAHQDEETGQGYFLIPMVVHLSNGVSWHIQFDARSPYEFRYEERGRYRLYRDGEPMEEVFFAPRPPWYDKKTSSGKPMASVISQRSEDFLCIAALTYCEYGKDNALCRYCNINSSESVSKEKGLERLTGKRDQDLYETMLAACQDRTQRSMFMSGGVILDPSKEADNYARITKVLRRAEKDAGYQNPMPLMVKTQAMEPEDALKLKEAGVTALGYNLEVWDPKLFEIICPGKAKYVGRERWLERLVRAVEVFGEGRISSSMVLGMEMGQPYGFKDEDDAAESYLEGWEWMLEHGVVPSGALWRPEPGTDFAGQLPPRTEYFLRMDLARYKMTVRYKGVPKRGKPANYGLFISADLPHLDPPSASAAAPRPSTGSSGEVC